MPGPLPAARPCLTLAASALHSPLSSVACGQRLLARGHPVRSFPHIAQPCSGGPSTAQGWAPEGNRASQPGLPTASQPQDGHSQASEQIRFYLSVLGGGQAVGPFSQDLPNQVLIYGEERNTSGRAWAPPTPNLRPSLGRTRGYHSSPPLFT